MTKTYIIENLGCANCAAKMEAKINALPSVESATLTFATRQLQVTSEDPDALLGQLQQIIGSIESDAYIAPADAHTLFKVVIETRSSLFEVSRELPCAGWQSERFICLVGRLLDHP